LLLYKQCFTRTTLIPSRILLLYLSLRTNRISAYKLCLKYNFNILNTLKISTTLESCATPNNSINIDILDRTTTTNTIVINKPKVFYRERKKLNN